jgi:hypothetical protein
MSRLGGERMVRPGFEELPIRLLNIENRWDANVLAHGRDAVERAWVAEEDVKSSSVHFLSTQFAVAVHRVDVVSRGRGQLSPPQWSDDVGVS